MSFLPGLGLSTPAPTNVPTSSAPRQIDLAPNTEWRFEVAFDASVHVKALPFPPPNAPPAPNNGLAQPPTAELFGTELALNHTYNFSGGAKAAIYTYHGASLAISGSPCESEYVSEEAPMHEYANIHFALENLRSAAAAARAQGGVSNDSGGPRVLAVGPDNAGKTSLLKVLASYAVRAGRSPLVASLDPREGLLGLPGSVSAAVLGRGAQLDVEDAASGGWGGSAIAGPAAVPVKTPLVYHYGWARCEERPGMFLPCATRLALAASSRFEEDGDVRDAGMLLDIGGSVATQKGGYEVVQHVVSEFSVNVLLVLGSERLYSDMQRRFGQARDGEEKVHVLKVSKSGGCVDRDEDYMRLYREQQIRNYFFGSSRASLSPHTQVLDFDQFQVLKLVDPTDSSSNAAFLPGGQLDDDTASKILTPVSPSMGMSHALLVIKHVAPTDTQEAIRDASVMGYIYVADIDEVKKKVKVLTPVGGRLPAGRAIVWGSWPEVRGDLLG